MGRKLGDELKPTGMLRERAREKEREARPGGGQVIKRGQTDTKNRSADGVRLCRGQSGTIAVLHF